MAVAIKTTMTTREGRKPQSTIKDQINLTSNSSRLHLPISDLAKQLYQQVKEALI